MNKHTPGPWALRVATDYAWIAAEGKALANVPADDTREGAEGIIEEVLSAEAKANAQLIAHAPDMLETLKRAYAQLGRFWSAYRAGNLSDPGLAEQIENIEREIAQSVEAATR